MDFELEGADPPDIEVEGAPQKTVTKRKSPNKVFVQKIITEVYVYTDFAGKGVGEIVNQRLFILGEMTPAKLRKIVTSERQAYEEEG
jgi:hypothetical protein